MNNLFYKGNFYECWYTNISSTKIIKLFYKAIQTQIRAFWRCSSYDYVYQNTCLSRRRRLGGFLHNVSSSDRGITLWRTHSGFWRCNGASKLTLVFDSFEFVGLATCHHRQKFKKTRAWGWRFSTENTTPSLVFLKALYCSFKSLWSAYIAFTRFSLSLTTFSRNSIIQVTFLFC